MLRFNMLQSVTYWQIIIFFFAWFSKLSIFSAEYIVRTQWPPQNMFCFYFLRYWWMRMNITVASFRCVSWPDISLARCSCAIWSISWRMTPSVTESVLSTRFTAVAAPLSTFCWPVGARSSPTSFCDVISGAELKRPSLGDGPPCADAVYIQRSIVVKQQQDDSKWCLRNTKPRLAPQHTVLPPGEFNSIIPIQVPIYPESLQRQLNSFPALLQWYKHRNVATS